MELVNRVCELCSRPGNIFCLNCFKVCYCSEKHKKNREQKHKAECYPGIVKWSATCGRYTEATRDIQAGEIIYTEKAVMYGPVMEGNIPLYPTCLGCCHTTNLSYLCSKCRWPVCKKECEKIPEHAKFECKIFRKNKVPYIAQPQLYQCIIFLRCLLLRDKDEEKFKRLMSLESHSKERREDEEGKYVSRCAFRFINEVCKLTKFDYDVVDSVVGINYVNSFGGNKVTQNRKRKCSLIFPQLSMLNHNCVPNTRLIMKEGNECCLRASVPIQKGDSITHQYVNVTIGTVERRSILYKNWYFYCSCQRCSDPSELGTYFSAVKCSDCSKGFLLPSDPLDPNNSSQWRCNNNNNKEICNSVKEKETVDEIISEVEEEILNCKKSSDCFSNHKLEQILNKHSGATLHWNHYVLIKLQYEIVEQFENINRFNTNQTSKPVSNDDDLIQQAKRLTNYCRSMLDVANIICPGQKNYRGVLNYYLCYCLSVIITNNSNDNDFKSDLLNEHNIALYIRETKEILGLESLGTNYRNMEERIAELFKERCVNDGMTLLC